MQSMIIFISDLGSEGLLGGRKALTKACGSVAVHRTWFR